MKKNKYKYLLTNIGLLTLSNFVIKIINFFMVPLYTNILSTSEYGILDYITNIISILIPLFTLNICDSLLVFFLDKKKNKADVFASGLYYSSLSFIYLFAFIGINYFFKIIPIINDYLFVFILYYVANLFYSLFSSCIRGIEKISVFSFATILNNSIMVLFNILFLVVFKFGFYGYMVANVLGYFVACIYMFIAGKIWEYFSFNRNIKVDSEIITYSKPLVLESIGWWINGSLDRYVVTFFYGISANGILAIGNKIPTILNIFQNVFNNSWQLSSVTSFDSKDSDCFFSNIYNTYNFLMIVLCSLLIISDKFLASFLYAKDFYVAWKYVPFYLMAIVFGASSGFTGGIFKAVKDSKIPSITTIAGAIFNLIFNVLFVYFLGPIGAPISTAISYFGVSQFRLYKVFRYIKLKINYIRDFFAYLILFLQAIILLFVNNLVILYSLQFVLFFIIMVLYYRYIVDYINLFINKIKR